MQPRGRGQRPVNRPFDPSNHFDELTNLSLAQQLLERFNPLEPSYRRPLIRRWLPILRLQ